MIYFVSTPIGNLKDISLRALEVLSSVDIIACEDTRTSQKLLKHYQINKKLIAYHKFNEKNSAKGIVEQALLGKDIAVISDSGTPLISDPGFVLTGELAKNNIEYTAVPGANALLPALVLSGFDTSSFVFLGFLPEKASKIKKILQPFVNLPQTLVIYISPHGLEKQLEEISKSLQGRNAVLVNEITKLHEKTVHFVLGQNTELPTKGEFVLVIEGAEHKEVSKLDDIESLSKSLIKQGKSKSETARIVSEELGVSKNLVYDRLK